MKKIVLIATLAAGLMMQPMHCINLNWKKIALGTFATAVFAGLWGCYKGWFTSSNQQNHGKRNNTNNNIDFDYLYIFTKNNNDKYVLLLNSTEKNKGYVKYADLSQYGISYNNIKNKNWIIKETAYKAEDQTNDIYKCIHIDHEEAQQLCNTFVEDARTITKKGLFWLNALKADTLDVTKDKNCYKTLHCFGKIESDLGLY